MKSTAAACLPLLLAGCAVQELTYYAPTDKQYLVEQAACDQFTEIRPQGARVPLRDGIAATLAMTPAKESVELAIQIPLLKGQSVRFESNVLELTLPSGEKVSALLKDFQVGVYGRGGRPGHHETAKVPGVLMGLGRNEDLATEKMQYLKYDLYVSSARFATEAEEHVVLHLPVMEVGGDRVAVPPLAFHRVAGTAVYGGCPG